MSYRFVILVLLTASCAAREVAVDPPEYSGQDAGTMSDRDGGHPDGGNRLDGGSQPDGGSPVDAGTETCDPPCSSASRCVNGQCILITCMDPETRCGSECVNPQTDPQHCGSCSHVCPRTTSADPVCVEANCGLHCTADPAGQTCSGLNACTSGHCCPSNQVWCTDHCADTTTDLADCGGCDQPCTAPSHGNATCVGSQCQLSCNDALELCGTACTDVQSDSNHCGTCDRSCSGSACLSGACSVGFATCTISASSGWQTCSGLSVNAGDVLLLSASGRWVWAPTWDPTGCDPTGESVNPVFLVDYRYSTASNFGDLLWAIENGSIAGSFDGAPSNDSGTAFVVNATSPGSGRILFRINDADSSYHDNTGSMSVRVDVAR